VEHKELEGHEGELEPVVERKTTMNELMAEQMKNAGIHCEPLALGSHPIERKPTSGHMFALTSRLTTNRGLVKVRGRNIDFVQIVQRN
jgi:hypothetical protein